MHSRPSSDVMFHPCLLNRLALLVSPRILEPGDIPSVRVTVDEILTVVIADNDIISAITIYIHHENGDWRIQFGDQS